jgi:tricarballylate dehydrogenase
MEPTYADLDGPWDVVIVGHGAAGLSAAASFLENHAGESPRVAVLDRASRANRGGSSAWTTAMFRLDDDAQLAPDWGPIMRETTDGQIDEAYIEAFYENASETLNWIRQRGVKILKFPAGVPNSPSRHGYSIEGGGRAFVDTFAELVQEKGGRCFYEVEACGLIRGGDGPVTGVRVRTPEGREHVMSTAAVVLACGGFEGNRAMLGRYIPNGETLATVAPGSQVNTGAGITMATAIGAATAGDFSGAHMEGVDPRSPNPEALINTWMFGIIVDRNGQRFVDEASTSYDMLFDYVANAVHRKAGGAAFAVNDASVRAGAPIFGDFNWTSEPPITADSLEELAEKLEIDPAALRATVDEYNRASVDVPYDGSVVDERHTVGLTPPKSHWAQPLTQAPFEAWPVSPRICFTYGGIKVDSATHVIDEGGKPIAGLYAAGELTGIFQSTYPSGTSVLRSLTFGRIAGQAVAELLAVRAS